MLSHKESTHCTISLAQVYNLFRNRILFEKYVDSDQLIEGAVEDIANLLFEEIDLEESADDSFFSAKTKL